MSDKPVKFSFTKVAIIVCVIWTAGLGGGFFTQLSAYSAPTVEEIREDAELIGALAPTFAFQCHGNDESKAGSNLECEDRVLLDRDRMVFYIKTMRIYLFYFFTAPLLLWIFFMAFPRAFAFIRRRFD